MLQNIHDKAKGWVAYAIVGFIAVPFALFGISSYLGGGGSLVAATVNGEEVQVQEVQNSVIQQRANIARMFGGKLPDGFDDNAIKQQALEQIINRILLRQESTKYGYRASNQEVYDTIAEIPAFQVDGNFDVKTYERLLTSQRRTKVGFETELRQSLSNQQFSQAMDKTAFLTNAEASRYQRLQNQTRDIETYTLKGVDFVKDVSVSDEEIKTYFDANSSQFLNPEKVKLSYVELKEDDIAATVEIADEALEAFYEENADNYTTQKQQKLAHILVKIDQNSGVDAEKKAKKRAENIYEQLKSGAKTFEDLATTDSDDLVAAKKSGEIGFLAKGDMGPLFEALSGSLKKGEFSKPAKTEAGFEIIKLLDVIEATQKTYAEVKAEVETAYRAEQAEKIFLDSSDKLQTLAFENESSLDAAADAVGLKVKSSDWIVKGLSSSAAKGSLFASPKLITAAFSDDVLVQGKNSELLEIDASTVVVIRKEEFKAASQKPLADVANDIKAILTTQKLRKVLITKGEQVLKALKEGANWRAVEAIGGSASNVEKKVAVTRNDPTLAAVVTAKVFSMEKPVANKTTYSNAILQEGDYVLIALSKVTNDAAEVSDSTKSRFSQILGSRERTAMLKAMREEADVELFLENIQ